MAIQKLAKIWLDGKLVPWEDAHVHVLTHTLHYGLGAFEGIRCYQQADGRPAIFRLREHLDRLYDTCKIITIKIPYAIDELVRACLDVVRENGVTEAYIRPIVFLGDEGMGLGAMDVSVRVAVIAYPWGAYLGEEGMRRGIRCKVSSFQRHHVNVGMTLGKITGQYFNSILAKREALAAHYDEAIMLDGRGYVSEGSGENLFIARHGQIRTPPIGAAILPGITRDSVIRIARDLGYNVEEANFTRDEMYIADELFLTGTAAEITPVREVDDRPVGTGEPGALTRKIQSTYDDVVHGRTVRYSEWLTHVER